MKVCVFCGKSVASKEHIFGGNFISIRWKSKCGVRERQHKLVKLNLVENLHQFWLENEAYHLSPFPDPKPNDKLTLTYVQYILDDAVCRRAGLICGKDSYYYAHAVERAT